MIKAEHLRKQYSSVLAVDDVSLEVPRGSIFGLLGPNGAGKSTSIRMILNIISPDAGSVTFGGMPFSRAVQDKIGYLPEERGLYRKNKLLDTIVYFASLRGIPPADAKRKAMEWLRKFELQDYAKRKVEELSKGNQQKIQFLTAILHDPEYVVLDEPFTGLDPVNQIVLKDIFQELKQQGKAIIFSTHQMDSAEKLCDEICLINHGKIVLEGRLNEVKQKFGKNSVHLEFIGDGSFISTLPNVKKATVYENYAELQLNGALSSRELISAVSSRVEIRKFEFVEPSLNSIFLEAVGLPDDSSVPPQPAPTTLITKPTVATDRRVRNSLLSFLVLFVATSVVAIVTLKKGSSDWNGVFFLGAVTVATLIRFLRTRKSVEAELKNRTSEVSNVH
ncbi:MAG TPA: ATP-binding cassette domain-containing protein [Bacteroidota bacterium]|nr:ATP-binding cassette domain-containing protein [Bacteroidota bacterium]